MIIFVVRTLSYFFSLIVIWLYAVEDWFGCGEGLKHSKGLLGMLPPKI
jgi:hypothetical protein